VYYVDATAITVLPPFHSTCPGEFFLRVLIRCLFSHFSVEYSILCTSWRGRRILFRRFFAVFKCLIHRYKHNNRIPFFLSKSESACLQYLRQYWTHTKHEHYGRYGIPSKNCSRLPTLSSPRSVEALCITWWHPWVLSSKCPEEQLPQQAHGHQDNWLPQQAHGHQDPCACALYGKLEDVAIFLFWSVKWRLRLRCPDLMLNTYR
jgi:hypothetical protein